MTASLRELLERGVARSPGRVVLVAGETRLTWGELYERACRVADALVRDGVGPRDRVCYLGKNDVRLFEVVFGCALAAAVPIPLSWRIAPGELGAIVADCAPSVLVVDPVVEDLVERAEPELRPTPLIVSLGRHARWPEYGHWLGAARDPGLAGVPGDVALQLYTSGTTGRPKGAMFAGGTSLRALLDDISVQWGFTPDDVSLVAMPLFHMGGLGWALAGLARGACNVIVRDFVPADVVEVMQAERVTTAFCVPTMLAALCAVPGVQAAVAPSLRRMIYSGAPIDPAALAAAMDTLRCEFVQLYGLTEATGAFAQLAADEHDPTGPRAPLLLSAGRPYPWVEVRVGSGDTGDELPVGQVGEIWTRSAQNMVGYWRQPEETARALTPEGWLRTGDLGRVDGQGYIYLVDRAKDLIISGGENVYPAEVEQVLAAHPDVAEVAVIAVPDPRWGETVKALVVARPGAEVRADGVIEFARTRLPGFKCPTSVDLVTVLPRTATGKVMKQQLRERYWRDHERRIH